MHDLIIATEARYKKDKVVAVRSGDTVKVTQRIKEANKERLQVFEGLVIRVKRRQSLTYQILVRKIASGVAVEKGFLMHSPNVVKVEVVKRAKVRRNYLSYMRQRVGKAARLKNVDFDKDQVNQVESVAKPAKKSASSKEDSAEKTPAQAAEADQAEAKKEVAAEATEATENEEKAPEPAETQPDQPETEEKESADKEPAAEQASSEKDE